jgi:hypothetical protein
MFDQGELFENIYQRLPLMVYFVIHKLLDVAFIP